MGILGDASQGITPKLAQNAAAAGAPPPGGAAPAGGAPPAAGPAPAPAGPAPGGAPGGAPSPEVQQMAQQAIESAKAGQGGGAPAPGGPAPGGPAPGGPAPGGPAPGGAPAPGGGGVRTVDPGQEAVEGQLPASMTEEKATPEEQKEYERAMQALAQVLYNNPEVANAIVDQIDPNDKVSSTAKVSMLLIKQIDEKIQLDVNVVAEVTKETVGRIEELAEARHGIEYGGREHQVILGSTWEGIQKMFGMEKEEAEALMAGVGGEGLADLKQQYDGFLNG